MSSPQVVYIYLDDGAGNPYTGASPSFDVYIDSDGGALTQPSIDEIGSGFYQFEPTFPTDKGVLYVMDTDGGNPLKVSGALRPEDYNIDNLNVDLTTLATASSVSTLQADVTALKKIETGRWKIHTSGPDANRLVIYDTDETTPLYKFNLKDSAGSATYVNPFERDPV